MQIDKFIVIVTYGRSGSTVLQRVLQTIPGAVIRGENNNTLFHLYMAWKLMSDAKKQHGHGNQKSSDPWWGMNLVDAGAFREKLANLFIQNVLHPDTATSILGFKEIRYHEAAEEMLPFLNFIRDAFKNARFIFHTRNLDETVKSGWWASRDENKVRATLAKAEMRFREFAQANPDISFEMNYQSLVGQTNVLWDMFRFIGVDADRVAVGAVLREKLIHAPTRLEK